MDFGSGSSLLGGTSALQEAMARRQTGQAGVTAQQSPTSAGGGSPMPSAPTSSAPQMPIPPAPPAGPMQPPPGAPAPTPTLADNHAMENQIILKALSGKMKSNSDIAESQMIPQGPTSTGA